MANKDRVVILVCLTHGNGLRLGEALEEKVADAKMAISQLPGHRNCYIDTIPDGGGSPVMPEALAAKGFGIFPHVARSKRNCPNL